MSGNSRREPPRMAERILLAILPAEDSAPVTRDLSELYQLRLRDSGSRRATAWYWWQIVSFAMRQLVERLGRGTGNPRTLPITSHGHNSVSEILVHSTLQDLRYSVRGLLRAPGFTLVALVTLGLGIAASTSIFSVVNGILLRPLPYPDSNRLVELFRTEEDGEQLDNNDPPLIACDPTEIINQCIHLNQNPFRGPGHTRHEAGARAVASR